MGIERFQGSPQDVGAGGAGGMGGPGGEELSAGVMKNLDKMLELIQTSVGADQVSGLVSLRQQVETLEKTGHVTEGDVESIRTQLATLAENPKLPPVDQNAVRDFATALNRLPSGTLPLGGGPGMPGNPFLDCSAILELFKMTSKICIELAKIQQAEAEKRIQSMEMQKEAAAAAATLEREAGEVASEKELTQAAACYEQAGVALGTACMVSLESFIGEVQSRSAYNSTLKANGGAGKPEAVKAAMEEQTRVDTRYRNLATVTEKLSEASKNFIDALMHKKLSPLEYREAVLKAAAGYLKTLAELQAQTQSTLGQAISALQQEIEALVQKMAEAERGWGGAWQPRG